MEAFETVCGTKSDIGERSNIFEKSEKFNVRLSMIFLSSDETSMSVCFQGIFTEGICF
jgi:hypothetical protein